MTETDSFIAMTMIIIFCTAKSRMIRAAYSQGNHARGVGKSVLKHKWKLLKHHFSEFQMSQDFNL